jgi:hypothetical protein
MCWKNSHGMQLGFMANGSVLLGVYTGVQTVKAGKRGSTQLLLLLLIIPLSETSGDGNFFHFCRVLQFGVAIWTSPVTSIAPALNQALDNLSLAIADFGQPSESFPSAVQFLPALFSARRYASMYFSSLFLSP